MLLCLAKACARHSPVSEAPDFDTSLKVVGALGLKLHAEAPRGRLRGLTSRSRSRTTKPRAA